MMGMRLYFFAIIFIISNSWGQTLSPQKIYRRCYSQLVQSPVPLQSMVMDQIKSGTLNPIDACLALFEKGNLNDSGLLQTNDMEAQKILQTFQDFHRTWFSSNTLEQIQDYNEEVNKGSTDVYDPNEQAYYLTYNLLAKNQKYSDILQGNLRFKGIRNENVTLNRKIGLFWNYSFPSRVKNDPSLHALLDLNIIAFRSLNKAFDVNGDNRDDADFATAPKLQVGELVGIQKNQDSFIVKNIALEPLGQDRPGNKEPNLQFNFDIKDSFGGGILGLPSYFLMNMGHSRGMKFNGTTKLPRRWIKASLETFMCSSFPTLRESDILSLVKENSETPFRKASSCVQCHASLDQAASVAGNLTSGSTDYFVIDRGKNAFAAKSPIVLTKYNAIKAAASDWSDVVDNEFHIKVPRGKFFTRSMTGDLISRDITSINDLGIAMSQTSDFYTCTAKRYFEFFTGIQVALYDRKDPRNAELNKNLSPESIEDRHFIEELGRDLQHSQSLKDLVKRILKSKYYSQENFR